MLSERVEFRDFDGERLGNLSRLLPGVSRLVGPGPAGLIVLRRDGRVVKVLHTHRGRLEPGPSADATSLCEAATGVGARWAIAADLDALAAANEAASARLVLGCDPIELALEVARALSDQAAAGAFELWPPIFDGVRIPSRDDLERLFDTVLPTRSSALVYVFDGTDLFAEVICVRGARDITTIAGHDALRSGQAPRRWREGYGQILDAARRELAPPSIGIFVARETLQRLLAPVQDGELPRALARRDLIFDPLPTWLAGPLGVLAARDVVEAGRRAGERLISRVRPDGLGAVIAGRVAGRLRRALPIERVGRTVDKLRRTADLSELIGFDPFVLGARLVELLRPDDDPSGRRSRG